MGGEEGGAGGESGSGGPRIILLGSGCGQGDWSG